MRRGAVVSVVPLLVAVAACSSDEEPDSTVRAPEVSQVVDSVTTDGPASTDASAGGAASTEPSESPDGEPASTEPSGDAESPAGGPASTEPSESPDDEPASTEPSGDAESPDDSGGGLTQIDGPARVDDASGADDEGTDGG